MAGSDNHVLPLAVSSLAAGQSRAVHRFIYLSDVAGSSRLAEAFPQVYRERLAQHNTLIEEQVAAHGGRIYKNTGDGYFALFESATALTECAADLSRAFGKFEPFTPDEPFYVRIALHAGELHPSGAEYFGPPLNRVSRICQVCNAGQVLLSGAVLSALDTRPLSDTALRFTDLGEHHLRDLSEPEHLYQLDHPDFALHQFPPLATLNNRPNNLVEQPNRFIGRTQELSDLAELLEGGQRLVTIVAPGGYGKSRLAAQLCANLLPQYERGCFMVYLAPVRDSAAVPMAIVEALRFQLSGSRDPTAQLSDYLRAKELLLCLDNFEHVLESTGMVRTLLDSAPKLRIVVTSREPLRIEGEQVVLLDPLGVESAVSEYSESEKLFADRARLVKRDFVVNAGNHALAHDICLKLSGIPLVIELAAAWMDTFTLEELRDELGNQLEIEARSSDKPERHRSLKASLDWSWNLLGDEQRRILMKLSTFRGGFFSSAAEAILETKGMQLRAALARLCDKSWLYSREVDGRTRFYLRDMLAHEYAFEKLKEQGQGNEATGSGEEQRLFESAVRAHAAHFAALAELEGPNLHGGGSADSGAAQMRAIFAWRTDLMNVEEALDTSLRRGMLPELLAIARQLSRYFSLVSAFMTQRDRYKEIYDAAQLLGNDELLVLGAVGMSKAMLRLGLYAEALGLAEQSLQISREAGDMPGEAASLATLANVCYFKGDYDQSLELQTRALELLRMTGDRRAESASLGALGVSRYMKGDFAQAEEFYLQALAVCREVGNRLMEPAYLGNLAIFCTIAKDNERALQLYEEALGIDRQYGNRWSEATVLANMGIAHCALNNFAVAEQLQSEALAIRREIGDRWGESTSLTNLADVNFAQNRYEQASEFFGQSLVLCRELGNQRGEATALGRLGDIQYQSGDYSGAAELQSQAIAIRHRIGHKSGLSCSLLGAAAAICAGGGPNSQRIAAIGLAGGLNQAALLNFHIDAVDLVPVDRTRARLDAAVAAGEISAEQLAAWAAEGEAMSLDELADFMQKALGVPEQSSGASGPAD